MYACYMVIGVFVGVSVEFGGGFFCCCRPVRRKNQFFNRVLAE